MYLDFSGVIKYEKEFYLPEADKYLLDLGEVGEDVSVYIIAVLIDRMMISHT